VPPAMPDGEEPVMGAIPTVGEHTTRILAELGLTDQAPDEQREDQ